MYVCVIQLAQSKLAWRARLICFRAERPKQNELIGLSLTLSLPFPLQRHMSCSSRYQLGRCFCFHRVGIISTAFLVVALKKYIRCIECTTKKAIYLACGCDVSTLVRSLPLYPQMSSHGCLFLARTKAKYHFFYMNKKLTLFGRIQTYFLIFSPNTSFCSQCLCWSPPVAKNHIIILSILMS